MVSVRKFLIMGLCAIVVPMMAHGAELQSVASVNITSDTASTAKNMAFNEARRQIITDVLKQYANVEQLDELIKNSSDAQLTELITSSSVDGEQQSDTTYSANITMTVNRDLARNWLTENNVQNWLTDGGTGDVFVVQAVMSDRLAGWMELRRIARAEGINLATQYINGNQITIEVPVANRAEFTIALREAGWQYADQNGVLHILK